MTEAPNRSADEEAVRALHVSLLGYWNRRDAAGLAALFAENGVAVGFDGSQIDGRAEIESVHRRIFAEHPTGRFVGKVRDVRFVRDDVALLRAVAGMMPSGHLDLDAALNAMQSLVATRADGAWRVALFHNTPAAFHGRPQERERLTFELREALRQG